MSLPQLLHPLFSRVKLVYRDMKLAETHTSCFSSLFPLLCFHHPFLLRKVSCFPALFYFFFISPVFKQVLCVCKGAEDDREWVKIELGSRFFSLFSPSQFLSVTHSLLLSSFANLPSSTLFNLDPLQDILSILFHLFYLSNWGRMKRGMEKFMAHEREDEEKCDDRMSSGFEGPFDLIKNLTSPEEHVSLSSSLQSCLLFILHASLQTFPHPLLLFSLSSWSIFHFQFGFQAAAK